MPLSLAVGANVNDPSDLRRFRSAFRAPPEERRLQAVELLRREILRAQLVRFRGLQRRGQPQPVQPQPGLRKPAERSRLRARRLEAAVHREQRRDQSGQPAGAESAAARERTAEELQRRDRRGHGLAVHPLSAVPVSVRHRARINDSRGFADFNSLQVRLSHAFSHGFQFDFNYTWSKELDYTSTATEDGQGFNSGGTAGAPDILNLHNNRRYGSADTPHRATAVLVYELPFGPGKALATANKLLNAIVGQLAGGHRGDRAGGHADHHQRRVRWRPGRPAATAFRASPLEVPKELQKWYDGVTLGDPAVRPHRDSRQEHLPQVQRLRLRRADHPRAQRQVHRRSVLGGAGRAGFRRFPRSGPLSTSI